MAGLTVAAATGAVVAFAASATAAPPLSPVAAPPTKQQIAAADLAWAAKHAPGSKAWAISEAKRTGKPVVASDETTATTYTVANPNGTLTTELTSGPERVWKDGKWQPFDATLTTGPGGSVVAKSHPEGLRLAGKAGRPATSLRAAQSAPATDLATIGDGDNAITLGWRGGLPQPQLNGTRATYKDAVPGADVIVEATRTGFEQFVQINQRPGGAYSYTLPVKAPGLKAKQRGDGSVLFTDRKTGAQRFIMPAPKMWDAKTDPVTEAPANVAKVAMKVVDKGAGDIDLQITPDAAWLNAPERQYPVTVDPTAGALRNHGDVFVREGEASDWKTIDLWFGKSPGGLNRSYITWETDKIADSLIVDAKLSLFNFTAANDDCKPKQWTVWDTGIPDGTISWDNQNTKAPWNKQYSSSTETHGHDACGGNDWINANVTDLVQVWASRKTAINALGLRAGNETDLKAFKKVASANYTSNQPKLTVTYNFRPDEGGNDLKAGPPFKSYAGVWATNTTQTLLRDTFTDRDGDKVRGSFQVYDAATDKPVAIGTDGVLVSAFVDPGKSAEVKVPAGVLQNGRTYKFRTSTYDGTHYSTTWSAWRNFVVDTTPPGEPAKISSALYPEDMPGGGKGQPGQFNVDTGVDDARAIEYRLDAPEEGARASAVDWTQTPTTGSSGSFSATPSEDGGHDLEVRTVDRADNVGPARPYGFMSPSVDVNRPYVVDIKLPNPQAAAADPAFHDEPIPAFDLDSGGMLAGTPRTLRKGSETVVVTPLAELTRSPEQLKAIQAARARRSAAAPPPITGGWCNPAAATQKSLFTRTEACLIWRYGYFLEDQATKRIYHQTFNMLYQVKVDQNGDQIKTWVQITPEKPTIMPPYLPFPATPNSIHLDEGATLCQGKGCGTNTYNQWTYSQLPSWAGNADNRVVTGSADFAWNGEVNNAAGKKDADLSMELPLQFKINFNGTVQGGVFVDQGPVFSKQLSARCDTMYSDPGGCVLKQYIPGYTINAKKYPAAAAHVWLIQNKSKEHFGRADGKYLKYLPGNKKWGGAESPRANRDPEDNRKEMCKRGRLKKFYPHPDTSLHHGHGAATDTKSCDEYPFAATYQSAGFPAPDGENPADPPESGGAACTQTVGLFDGSVERFVDDTRWEKPKWPAKCGRSSMSTNINSGSMNRFGLKFAPAFRLMDKDEYWVDPDNDRFTDCDGSKDEIKCTMKP